MTLTPDVDSVQDTYTRDGVVLLKNILSNHWLKKLRLAVDSEVQKGDRYFAYKNMREKSGTFQDYCLNSDVGQRVAEVADSPWTSLIYDQIFAKEPGTKTQTGWHTDQPYWPVAGPIMTIWIALDPVDADNGALEFIRGSHAWGAKYRPFKTDQLGAFTHYLEKDNPDYVDMPDFEKDREIYEIVHFDRMEPGDALAFDGMTVHSAMGNRTTTRRRRGYAIRFAVKGAIYEPRDEVTEWLHDSSLKPGAPFREGRFPVIFGS
ncbi:MAG: phytanoyl-CoA dioxygenase [Rhizobiaceae bacterium]|nr:phytanoyl-CoA dioxygenase [Rhizobiaceae bacterium]